jgi:hypothetical protein
MFANAALLILKSHLLQIEYIGKKHLEKNEEIPWSVKMNCNMNLFIRQKKTDFR